MLQAANTELFNPLVPKACNSECQNLLSISFTNSASKCQQNLGCGFPFFAPTALMG